MNKYYNKEIPDELHVVFSDRHYAKTYYELMKLKERIEELEEENKTLKELNVCVGCNNNPDYKSRIDKAIEILESKKHCERLCGGRDGKTFTEQAIDILKGEEK